MHIITKDNKISPSSFIPFCDFGEDMSTVGVKIDQFDVPVCNSFQATILNDQFCYEIDLKTFSVNANIEKELKIGFNFLIDYNEDRQVTFDKKEKKKKLGLASNVLASDQGQHALIYLDTIGKYQLCTSLILE